MKRYKSTNTPIAVFLWILIYSFGFISCKTSHNITTISRADREAIESLEHLFAENEILNRHFVGFTLFDPITELTLVSYNGALLFTPASNNKLLTYYAAKTILGNSIPALNYFIQGDSIIIRGSGDPLFLGKFDLDSTAFHFLMSREENMYFDPTNFSEKRFGRGWAWDDYRYLYQKEIVALPIFDNEIHLLIDSSRHIDIYPSYLKPLLVIDSSINELVKREEISNEIVFNPLLIDDNISDVQVPMHLSGQNIADALSFSLNRQVELIRGDQLSDTLFTTLYHYSTDSIYYHLLVNSDNFIAEQLILCISNELFGLLDMQLALDSLAHSVYAQAPDKHRWVDGSGLSRYNLVSPNRMVWTLDQLCKTHSDEQLKRILPYGEEGTIDSIFLRPAGQDLNTSKNPFVYAKTGTLSNNHNMSGYVFTRSGRKLIFSFMNNHYMEPNSVIRKGMHQVLSDIYYKF